MPFIIDKTIPDVEEIVVQWLNANLPDSWDAYGDKPDKPPKKFILVDRNRGPRTAMVLDSAEILIEVYSKDSRMTAKDMAQVIADQIRGLTQYESITHADVNSLVHLDDTLSQYYRYQIYCDVFSRR